MIGNVGMNKSWFLKNGRFCIMLSGGGLDAEFGSWEEN